MKLGFLNVHHFVPLFDTLLNDAIAGSIYILTQPDVLYWKSTVLIVQGTSLTD